MGVFNSKSISQERFNFVSNVNYPLYQYCQICGVQRFTLNEILLLVDKTLTLETFQAQLNQHKYCNMSICHSESCAQKLFIKSGTFNQYSLEKLLIVPPPIVLEETLQRLIAAEKIQSKFWSSKQMNQ
jgi:hypothetical protein